MFSSPASLNTSLLNSKKKKTNIKTKGSSAYVQLAETNDDQSAAEYHALPDEQTPVKKPALTTNIIMQSLQINTLTVSVNQDDAYTQALLATVRASQLMRPAPAEKINTKPTEVLYEKPVWLTSGPHLIHDPSLIFNGSTFKLK